MLKVNIQLNSRSGMPTKASYVAKEIYRVGGVKGFYTGLDSALMR